ncbi:MAG: YggS family pyridoxal phosphate-dependent enzyme [Bacillaceae bacterium]|nr:YggS family pyridoxal phosphate-dependent enzyme [Bacillaceae bacterium]
MEDLEQRLHHIQERITAACRRSGRDPEEVNVVAVTKYVSTDEMKRVMGLGIEHVGENRVQHAIPKFDELGDRGTWHFIGHLQTNKVKDVIGKFHYIHSLDRISLLKEIDKRGRQKDVRVPCFVQVNISGEESKYGLLPNQVMDFMREAGQKEHVNVIGLMTMAPIVDDPEETRPIFRELRQLKEKINQAHIPGIHLEHLSMGMSQDFEVAVEEGATFVRIGSVLFHP